MKPQTTKATITAVTRWPALLLAISLVALPTQAMADEREEAFATLQAEDMRLAAIAERMLAANAPLCRRTMPVTGMIIHTRDQYGDPLPGWFNNGGAEVLAVLPGSPAERAGLQADDALLAIQGEAVAPAVMVDQVPSRDLVFDQLAAASAGSPFSLSYTRDGQAFETTINAPPGCHGLVEVLAETSQEARSDGRVIQISYGMTSMLNDEQLAAVFAHELAHSVLEHRRRLETAGVEGGLLGEFGRNRRLARRVEVEADLLSVHLLANAGFDPRIAPELWISDAGKRLDGGFFRARRYPSRKARAEMMEQEIADHLQDSVSISLAEHLLSQRDIPFAD